MRLLFLRIFFFAAWTLLLVGSVCSQNNSSSRNQTSSKSGTDLDIEFKDPLDTIEAKYFHLESKDKLRLYKPTKTLNINTQIDLIRYDWNEYLHLGNNGSSALPIQFELPNHLDLDFGFNQYNPYKKHHKDLKYFNLAKPISDLYFSPNGTGNFTVKALFADNYQNDIKLTIDYARINEDGSYTNQKTKSTALNIGVLFDQSENYKVALEYLVNNHNENQNGGVSDTSSFDQAFNSNRLSIPVFLQDASTRHQNFSYRVVNELLLGSDSTLINGSFRLVNNYRHGYFRYFDNDIDSTDYVGLENYIPDDRGIRYFLSYRTFENDFSLQTALKKSISLRAGIKYIRHNLDNEVDKTRINNAILYGNTIFSISDKIKLDGSLELGLGNISGSLDLKSKMDLALNKWFRLQGGFNFIRLNPSYLHENLTITQFEIWKRNFSRPIHSQIWAELSSQKLKTKVRFSQSLSDGLIYMDPNAEFQQLTDIFSVTQLSFTNELKLGFINLDNHVLFQAFNEDVLGLPEIFIKQRLYFNFKLFKSVLNNQIGFEHRYLGSRNRLGFNQIIGQFYPSNENFNNYPSVDLFALFSVGSFKFLLRADNLYFLFNNEVSYHVWPYPQNDYGLRIGVNWIISD